VKHPNWITQAAFALLVASSAGGCGNGSVSQPSTGVGTPGSAPQPPFRVSGQVLAHSPGGIVPAAGIHVSVESMHRRPAA
jgi:hypothetical protein